MHYLLNGLIKVALIDCELFYLTEKGRDEGNGSWGEGEDTRSRIGRRE